MSSTYSYFVLWQYCDNMVGNCFAKRPNHVWSEHLSGDVSTMDNFVVEVFKET